MIEIRCRTNLDGYEREQWPTSLPVVPTVGHGLRAESGKVLKIASLTWCSSKRYSTESRSGMMLEVELHW